MIASDHADPELSFSLTVSGAPPFPNPVEFYFRERGNVIVGANGTGKSTLLKILAGLPVVRFEIQSNAEQETLFQKRIDPPGVLTGKPIIYIGATRTELNAESVFSFINRIDRDSLLNKFTTTIALMFKLVLYIATIFVAYQAADFLDVFWHGLLVGAYFGAVLALIITDLVRLAPIVIRFFTKQERHALDDALSIDDDVSSIFLAEKVQGVMRLLLGTDANPKFDHAAVGGMNAARVALNCAQRIAPEVFTPGASAGTAVFVRPANRLYKWLQPAATVRQHMFTFDTAYSNDYLHVSNLSAGTQGPLMFIWWMTLKIAQYYEFQDDWESKPAILIIDEIENHLHPAWQRRVIPVLLDQFPKLQIVATTHSPFVLAGMKKGQIHLIDKDPTSKIVTCASNEYDVVGWTSDEILQVYLNVSDPTDETTATYARELRHLIDEGQRPDEHKENDRLSRIEQLRGLVHPAIRAGSPSAAADEDFIAQLARVLDDYRSSNESNAGGQQNA